MQKIMFNNEYGLMQDVLRGYKTQTRRIAKMNEDGSVNPRSSRFNRCEVVALAQSYQEIFDTVGTASVPQLQEIPLNHKGWHNKMFVRADIMPHRIEIADYHIERLQDISDEDCMKEGIRYQEFRNTGGTYFFMRGDCLLTAETARDAFQNLINKISGKGTWESNPYVFVYDFRLIRR